MSKTDTRTQNIAVVSLPLEKGSESIFTGEESATVNLQRFLEDCKELRQKINDIDRNLSSKILNHDEKYALKCESFVIQENEEKFQGANLNVAGNEWIERLYLSSRLFKPEESSADLRGIPSSCTQSVTSVKSHETIRTEITEVLESITVKYDDLRQRVYSTKKDVAEFNTFRANLERELQQKVSEVHRYQNKLAVDKAINIELLAHVEHYKKGFEELRRKYDKVKEENNHICMKLREQFQGDKAEPRKLPLNCGDTQGLELRRSDLPKKIYPEKTPGGMLIDGEGVLKSEITKLNDLLVALKSTKKEMNIHETISVSRSVKTERFDTDRDKETHKLCHLRSDDKIRDETDVKDVQNLDIIEQLNCLNNLNNTLKNTIEEISKTVPFGPAEKVKPIRSKNFKSDSFMERIQELHNRKSEKLESTTAEVPSKGKIQEIQSKKPEILEDQTIEMELNGKMQEMQNMNPEKLHSQITEAARNKMIKDLRNRNFENRESKKVQKQKLNEDRSVYEKLYVNCALIKQKIKECGLQANRESKETCPNCQRLLKSIEELEQITLQLSAENSMKDANISKLLLRTSVLETKIENLQELIFGTDSDSEESLPKIAQLDGCFRKRILRARALKPVKASSQIRNQWPDLKASIERLRQLTDCNCFRMTKFPKFKILHYPKYDVQTSCSSQCTTTRSSVQDWAETSKDRMIEKLSSVDESTADTTYLGLRLKQLRRGQFGGCGINCNNVFYCLQDNFPSAFEDLIQLKDSAKTRALCLMYLGSKRRGLGSSKTIDSRRLSLKPLNKFTLPSDPDNFQQRLAGKRRSRIHMQMLHAHDEGDKGTGENVTIKQIELKYPFDMLALKQLFKSTNNLHKTGISRLYLNDVPNKVEWTKFPMVARCTENKLKAKNLLLLIATPERKRNIFCENSSACNISSKTKIPNENTPSLASQQYLFGNFALANLTLVEARKLYNSFCWIALVTGFWKPFQ